MTTRGSAVHEARRTGPQCGDLDALKRLASVLVHEEWHVLNGSDQLGAYDAQLMALRLMHAGPGHPVYQGVARSRKALTLKRESTKSGPTTRANAP
jgi:hypothetical protein